MTWIANTLLRLFRSQIDRAIDRALDDGQPPRGLAAFVLRHSPELQRHYESMLALELALRFAPVDDATNSQTLRPVSRTTAAQSRRTALWTRLAVAATILIAVIALWPRQTIEHSSTSTSSTLIPTPEIVAVTETDSVPFSEITLVADALVSTALPQFGFPVASVVGFADAPLATTLAILESAGIVASQEVMEN